ncbi:MAG TPA: homogentisate 1,2-dioxygenase [Polyangiaceae bacterium]|jgi:homogentisate 1,2-dioxygenase|nr:homogentisate 1,2-dioxygenase [Polyangiaceae bacterium]
MLDRVAVGELPPKHHLALRGPAGELRYEECLTRAGFDGPYTILYHVHRPHALAPAPSGHVAVSPRARRAADDDSGLRRRHYRTQAHGVGGPPMDARLPVLFNDDVVIGILKATADDPAYFVNADGDELLFVLAGRGLVRSVVGDVAFGPNDYVCVPRGMLHRIVLEDGALDALTIECRGGVGVPRQWRNEAGQLRMDAPYSHRDFRRPTFRGPLDEGIRDVVVQRNGTYHGFRYSHSPLDVLGWDGAVYPFAFPILAFQPRVSSVHLPPTWHGTFAARGALVSSFVPRPLDFHPDAVPCPYPHSSVDVDEVLFYASATFTSRLGIGPGSITLHPAGLPHGPHPGRYEASPVTRHTDEIAVMLDCEKPLVPTAQARTIEDPDYETSFSAG